MFALNLHQHQRYLWLMFFLLFVTLSANANQFSSKKPNTNISGSKQTLSTALNNTMPLYFEKNVGQHPNAFHFVAKTAFSQFAFANNRVVIKLKNRDSINTKENKPYQKFSLIFQDAKKSPFISANKKSAYTVNYYRGKQSQWQQNIDTFSEIVYHDIYPGINLKFYFNQSRLEYDFIVKPGVDPSIIKFKYENTEGVSLSEDNTLDVLIDRAIVQQKAPVIYQWEGNKKKSVLGVYSQNDDDSFSFSLAQYDVKKTLIIDPVIEFSSYFGGNWEDNATTVATDSMGNIFLVGSTSAQARITINNIMTLENEPLPPMNDVAGLSTYDGEHGISLGAEYANGSQLDLTSQTYACDYWYKGFFGRDSLVTDYDGFISKFDANFNQIYTTYFGGCRNDGIRDMVIKNDNIYVAGFTLSDDLPTFKGVQTALAPSRFPSAPIQSDAFYAKFDNDGALLFLSYLGGDGRDGARAIAVDNNENIYITGYTHSTNLTGCSQTLQNVIQCENIGGIELVREIEGQQETSLYSDAFVAKISSPGDGIGFITYFGGSLDDWGQDIEVRDNANDPSQNGIYITGNTSSPDILTSSTGYSLLNYQSNTLQCSRQSGAVEAGTKVTDAHACEDVYLAKLSLDATALVFSTYLGGKLDDNVSDMEIDNLGNIYLFGTSKSQGARFELPTLLPVLADNLTDVQFQQYQDDNAGIIGLLNNRFPLYKNIRELGFNDQSVSSMAFLSVFKADGSALVLSSFIGGSGEDAGLSVELNDDGVSPLIDVYVGGHTLSNDFYALSAFQQTANNSELFVVKFAMDLSKADDAYDLPVCTDANNANTCSNPAGSTCNNISCDLYDIKYSTLIGGEDLDAFKDMHYSAFDGGIFLTGTTYSRLFPITSDALKQEIAEVKIRDYNPLTRNLELESSYYPSDMFLLKLSDTELASDWKISASLTNSGSITSGEKIKYQITVSRNLESSSDSNNTIGLTDARINLSFPYLADTERMPQYASLTNTTNCVMEYKQIYCLIGDIGADETKTITVTLLPRVTGDFPVAFSLMSLTSDTDMTNNKQSISTRIKVTPRASMGIGFLSFLLFLFLLRNSSFILKRASRIKVYSH